MVFVGLQCSIFRRGIFPQIVLLASLFTFIPFHSVSAASNPVEIQSIRVVSGSESDFVVSANKGFQFYIFALRNPDRLVIDCWPAVLAFPISGALRETHPIVSRIRAEPFLKNVVRVVFELKRRGKYSALISGNDLRIRIATGDNPPPVPRNIPSPPQPNNGIELSISNQNNNKTAAVRAPEQKPEAKKSEKTPWKMQGYVVDTLRRVPGANDNQPSMGSAYGMKLRFNNKNKDSNSSFIFNYTLVGDDYAIPYTDNYITQDLQVGYRWKLGSNWNVRTIGQVGLYDYGDQYTIRPEIGYRFNRRNSFSFYAGNRTKLNWYSQSRTDQDHFVGVKYKSKLGNRTFILGYQRDFNDSNKVRNDYIRTKYTIGYNVPWSKSARTSFRFDYAPQQYDSRYISDPIPDAEFGTLRYDQGWTFSMISRLRLSPTFEIVPRYTFQERISNDPSFDDYSLNIAAVALRARW